MSDEGASEDPEREQGSGGNVEPATDDGPTTKVDPPATDDGPTTESEPSQATTPESEGPRRLHPLTVAYQLGSTGIRIGIIALVVGVPGLSAAIQSGQPLVVAGAVLLILSIVGAIVGYSVVAYRRFEYELGPETFDIREGVLSRREREIPLRRIQNVDVSQRLPERVLGIAEVRLETAGGGSTEAQLRFVGVDEADRLQAEISRLRRGERTAATGEPGDEQTREPLFVISSKELAVLGITSVDPRVLSILGLAAPIVFDQMAVPVFVEPPVVGGPEELLNMLFGPVMSIVILILFALGAGVLNAMRFYGFRLERDTDELRYERGLLQRYSGTIPLSKVQSLTIRENVLARALGYASLTIETAGYAPGANGDGGSQSAVPLAERDRALALARSIEDANVETLERPPKRARTRYAVRYSIVVALLVGALWLGGQVGLPFPPWYLGFVAAPLIPVAAHLQWANRGYALGENHIVTQNGFWIRNRRVVPYHRVQTVATAETLFQRRRRLGTVVVDTAGSSSLLGDDAKAVDVDVETANRLREAIPTSLTSALTARRAASRRTR